MASADQSLTAAFERMRELFDQSRLDEYLANVSDRAFGVVVTEQGSQRSNRADFEAFLDSMQVLEFRVWDVHIQQIDDLGFAIFRHVQRQRIGGVESAWTGDGTEIFVRENGTWHLCGWHFNAFQAPEEAV